MDRQLTDLYTRLGRTLHAMSLRLRADAGQTAAEYIGLILLIAVVLGGIAGTDIGTAISEGIGNAIQAVFDERG